ncbi:MAG: hypothetical protein HC888_04440 [Candidatus Competibacteraceae bacterium]|nr:hypothetical protein [Candidatus Competibacteraceae bacterium]
MSNLNGIRAVRSLVENGAYCSPQVILLLSFGGGFNGFAGGQSVPADPEGSFPGMADGEPEVIRNGIPLGASEFTRPPDGFHGKVLMR